MLMRSRWCDCDLEKTGVFLLLEEVRDNDALDEFPHVGVAVNFKVAICKSCFLFRDFLRAPSGLYN